MNVAKKLLFVLCLIPIIANASASAYLFINKTNHNLVISANGVCAPHLGTVSPQNIKLISSIALSQACNFQTVCEVRANEESCTGASAGGFNIQGGASTLVQSPDTCVNVTLVNTRNVSHLYFINTCN